MPPKGRTILSPADYEPDSVIRPFDSKPAYLVECTSSSIRTNIYTVIDWEQFMKLL